MQTEFSTVSIDGPVLTVTVNRAAQANALPADGSHELAAIFDAFERDPALRVAILTGAGDTAFSVGAEIASTKDRPLPETGFAGLTSRFNRRKPVIAAVNGLALSGGFEAALACDIIIAAQSASFGLTEPRAGLAALGGGIQRVIAELGPKRAHVVLLTARRIGAEEAAQLGFVAEVVPAADLPAAARRWADEILACAPAAIAATKAVVQSLDGHGLAHSMRDMLHLPEVRHLLTGPDGEEAAAAAAQNRKPAWADPT